MDRRDALKKSGLGALLLGLGKVLGGEKAEAKETEPPADGDGTVRPCDLGTGTEWCEGKRYESALSAYIYEGAHWDHAPAYYWNEGTFTIGDVTYLLAPNSMSAAIGEETTYTVNGQRIERCGRRNGMTSTGSIEAYWDAMDTEDSGA